MVRRREFYSDSGSVLPAIHCACPSFIFTLLPNKTEDTYTRLLREIVARINRNGPGQILVDFERAAINAIITTIPNAVIKGCFYHLCSNVWKHIQRFGLCLRMLSALAFLPPQNVIPGFEKLCDYVRANYQDNVDEHFEYFDEELPRTNNSVEGWHRSIRCHVSACHPNFWRFLEMSKKEETVVPK